MIENTYYIDPFRCMGSGAGVDPVKVKKFIIELYSLSGCRNFNHAHHEKLC